MPAFRPRPALALAHLPSPLEELSSLRRALGGGPRLLIKRDDALSFAFGGNKVRKMQLVAADALAAGADTLITCGGPQSNHARVTAAAAARLGLRCVLVANGTPPPHATANALLDRLLGADVRYVADRTERAPMMEAVAGELRRGGGRPYVVPLGASTPLGALGFVYAIEELREQLPAPPDVIVHSTSSGGTQAGLLAGCARHGYAARVLGISADESSAALARDVRGILGGLAALDGFGDGGLDRVSVVIDDGFVGGGYGVPTDASREAIDLLARTEAIFLDPTYTAKAMAGLLARVRAGEFNERQDVLFWHTGGQVALFA
jgi:1-aminocyclopropane-1-carboxylate deaminase/D-cysteine desulfhydrase-like pyridoxal-dependent ACC family enzyme